MPDVIYTVPEKWRLDLFKNPPKSFQVYDEEELWQVTHLELFYDAQPWNTGKTYKELNIDTSIFACKGQKNGMYGRSRKGELAGEKNGMYGKRHKQKTKELMSAARQGRTPSKGMQHSDEYKNFMSEYMCKLKWFNNGSITIRAKECPPGFSYGRIKKKITQLKTKKIININGLSFNSCKEAAEYFNVSKSTITAWKKTGKAVEIQSTYEVPL